MKRKFVSFFILVIMISACSSTETVSITDTDTGETETPIADEAEDKPMDKLDFVDLRTFDKKLSKALKTDQEEIEIDLIAKFNTNEIPERLEKWFYVVDENEGKVEAKPIGGAQTRGIPGIGLGVNLIVGAYKAIRKKVLYGPAKHYDATLLYDPESGDVQKIVFKRRPESD